MTKHLSFGFRGSQQRCSARKSVIINFTKFTGKHLCQSPATLLKKRLRHRCFPENFAKFLRTPPIGYFCGFDTILANPELAPLIIVSRILCHWSFLSGSEPDPDFARSVIVCHCFFKVFISPIVF